MGGERGEQARAWLYMVECGIEFTAGESTGGEAMDHMTMYGSAGTMD